MFTDECTQVGWLPGRFVKEAVVLGRWSRSSKCDVAIPHPEVGWCRYMTSLHLLWLSSWWRWPDRHRHRSSRTFEGQASLGTSPCMSSSPGNHPRLPRVPRLVQILFERHQFIIRMLLGTPNEFGLLVIEESSGTGTPKGLRELGILL